MTTKRRVVIEVAGGVVRAVIADGPCEVHLLDYDELDCDANVSETTLFTDVLRGDKLVDETLEAWKKGVREHNGDGEDAASEG